MPPRTRCAQSAPLRNRRCSSLRADPRPDPLPYCALPYCAGNQGNTLFSGDDFRRNTVRDWYECLPVLRCVKSFESRNRRDRGPRDCWFCYFCCRAREPRAGAIILKSNAHSKRSPRCHRPRATNRRVRFDIVTWQTAHTRGALRRTGANRRDARSRPGCRRDRWFISARSRPIIRRLR